MIYSSEGAELRKLCLRCSLTGPQQREGKGVAGEMKLVDRLV